MKRSSPALLAAPWFALALLISQRAHASGIGGIRFGGELGSVVNANPTSIYYNPGALGFSGSQLMLDLAIVFRETTWTHPAGQGDVPEPAGFEGANYGTAHSFLVGVGPQFAASFQLTKDLVVAGGFFVPWGGGTVKFDRNERFADGMYPGAADGITRWHGYDAQLRYLYATAAAAWRFGRLSIGASGNLIFGSLGLKRAQNSFGNNDITREQRASFEVSEVVGSFGLGALFEALPEQLWFGASYQAQPGLGELTLDGSYTLDATVAVDDATQTQSVTIHQALPDIYRLGARFRPTPALELRLTGSFTRWSVNQTQCLALRNMPCTVNPDGTAASGSGVVKNLPRHWNDTFGVHGGASYWPSRSFEIFAGVGYEPTAVPDETADPLTSDANNISAAVGGRFRLFETWYFALSYNHQQFLPRDNIGKSRLADPAVGAISRGLDGGGQYRAWMGSANLNIAKTF